MSMDFMGNFNIIIVIKYVSGFKNLLARERQVVYTFITLVDVFANANIRTFSNITAIGG